MGPTAFWNAENIFFESKLDRCSCGMIELLNEVVQQNTSLFHQVFFFVFTISKNECSMHSKKIFLITFNHTSWYHLSKLTIQNPLDQTAAPLPVDGLRVLMEQSLKPNLATAVPAVRVSFWNNIWAYRWMKRKVLVAKKSNDSMIIRTWRAGTRMCQYCLWLAIVSRRSHPGNKTRRLLSKLSW